MNARRQYVAVVFSPGAAMEYTFHNDGEPLACGDQVLVAGRGGKGTRTVTVSAIEVPKPTFDTKPIIGRAPPPAPPEGMLL